MFVAFVVTLVIGMKGERKALAPYNTLRSLEAELFDSMHELDPARQMHDEYNAEIRRINSELAGLDAEYDAIPGGTVLYRRTGSFISKQEYTNEDWARIKSGQSELYDQKNKTLIPSMKRKIVALRAAKFHEIVREVDLDTLESKERLAMSRAVSRSDEYLKLRQSLVDTGIKTDTNGAIIRPEMFRHKVWLIVAVVLFLLSLFIWSSSSEV